MAIELIQHIQNQRCKGYSENLLLIWLHDVLFVWHLSRIDVAYSKCGLTRDLKRVKKSEVNGLNMCPTSRFAFFHIGVNVSRKKQVSMTRHATFTPQTNPWHREDGSKNNNSNILSRRQ